jgi:CO dehydrogenase/acetyl-CoA synthase gamma subunit (corrinoid Fe-S protein)
MEDLSGLDPRELSDWGAVEVYALSGADFVIVVSEEGAGLFHAGDVAQKAEEMAGEIPFPLYMISDERGEAPLVSVEVDDGEVLVAALFSSLENARDFRELAAHLDLPASLGTIEDRDGLRRHALIARQAGATYAVVDPTSGLTEAIPIEELSGP